MNWTTNTYGFAMRLCFSKLGHFGALVGGKKCKEIVWTHGEDSDEKYHLSIQHNAHFVKWNIDKNVKANSDYNHESSKIVKN